MPRQAAARILARSATQSASKASKPGAAARCSGRAASADEKPIAANAAPRIRSREVAWSSDATRNPWSRSGIGTKTRAYATILAAGVRSAAVPGRASRGKRRIKAVSIAAPASEYESPRAGSCLPRPLIPAKPQAGACRSADRGFEGGTDTFELRFEGADQPGGLRKIAGDA